MDNFVYLPIMILVVSLFYYVVGIIGVVILLIIEEIEKKISLAKNRDQ